MNGLMTMTALLSSEWSVCFSLQPWNIRNKQIIPWRYWFEHVPSSFRTLCSQCLLEKAIWDSGEKKSEQNDMIKNTGSYVAFLKGFWELFRGNANLFKHLFMLRSFLALASSALLLSTLSVLMGEWVVCRTVVLKKTIIKPWQLYSQGSQNNSE